MVLRRRVSMWVRISFAVSIALVAGACRSPPPPNIVLYVVDTLRFDALHCNGNTQVQTPAMDRLAAEGIRFTRAYTNASWTRPSMGTMLTGVYPSVHGAIGRRDVLRPGLRTLAAGLRAAGYRTAAVYANVNIGPEFGFADGFDDFTALYPARFIHDPSVPADRVGTADNVVNRAIEWLRQRGPKPFFLLVFSVDPHAPYEPPPPYNTMYDPDYTGSVDGSIKTVMSLLVAAKLGKPPAARDVQHLRALYQGEVSFNDLHLARLLAEIERLRLTASTLVVLTSDHGEEFYEHGLGDHGHSLYEELIHVPLIMRWPQAIKPQQTYTGAVQLVDLYPTLLGAAGAKGGSGPGRDLGDIVRGRAGAAVASQIYAEERLDDHDLRAVIFDQHKLIVDAARPQPLSFDLATDPGEQRPLGGPPPAELVEAMEAVESVSRAPLAAAPPIQPTQLPDSVRHALEALGYGDTVKQP